MRVAVIALALAGSVMEASAHSWMDCLDWRDGKCYGYARNFHKQPAVPFGSDVGRDQRPGAPVPQGLKAGPVEQPNANVEDGYSAEYPMGQVKPGSTITMRWPAKNHATVGTQRGVQLFISRAPGAGDDFSHIVSKDAWIAKYPGLEQTFSNCSPNRSGVDKAECTGNFQIPDDLEEGIYTFMWWWEFNAGEYYNSVADVLVTNTPTNGGGNNDGGNTGGTPATPTPPPTPAPPLCNNNLYAQCGGINFNGEVCCPSGSFCMKYNDWYSQCIPGSQQNAVSQSVDSVAGTASYSVGDYVGIVIGSGAGLIALVAGVAMYKKKKQMDELRNGPQAGTVAPHYAANPQYGQQQVNNML